MPFTSTKGLQRATKSKDRVRVWDQARRSSLHGNDLLNQIVVGTSPNGYSSPSPLKKYQVVNANKRNILNWSKCTAAHGLGHVGRMVCLN